MRRSVIRAIALLAVLVGTGFIGRGTRVAAADTTTVIVHYHRATGDYNGWNLWLWPNKPAAGNGAQYDFDGSDSFGKVAHAQVPCACTEVGIIVRLNDFQQKDISQDRFIETPNQHAEVWLIQGDPKIYLSESDAQAAAAEAGQVKPNNAFLDATTMALVHFSNQVDLATLKPSDFAISDLDAQQSIAVTAMTGPNGETTGKVSVVKLTLAGTPDLTHRVELKFRTYVPIPVKPRLVLNDPAYFYAGNDLGAVYSKKSTTFRVWAPLASAVSLVRPAANGGSGAVTAMQHGQNGTWFLKVTGNLKNTSYLYRVTNFGTTSDVVDPYARDITANAQAGLVVDLSTTNPPGWKKDHYRKTAHQTDASIYEVHVRDFSIDPNSGMKHRGKYLAFTERGTHTASGVKTGIDSVKALGITHIELLPTQGCHTLDEIKGGSSSLVTQADGSRYNWCYDPRNFNAPNGAYATSPNGTTRITEFKKMVQGIHRAGMGAILDVVYQHTFDTAVFDPIVPGYYYRTDDSGQLLGRTGVGNEVASERPMVRKFIVDSVKYWTRQYHVDGLRFDWMSYLGKQTMTQVAQAVRTINPNAVILGEPWSGDSSNLGGETLLTKGEQKNLHIGVFNDDYRDGLLGSVFVPQLRGYATGNTKNLAVVQRGVRASLDLADHPGGFAAQPDEPINYVSVHDGYTLWDHIALEQAAASEADRIKMDELAQGAVFTAQGVPYIEGGAEFLRTKGGNGNSYQAGDTVNMLDWNRKATYASVYGYYKGLIHLRAAHPAFRLTTAAAIQSHLTLSTDAPQNTTVFDLTGHAGGDKWKNIFVIYNPNADAVQIPLPAGKWTIVGTTGTIGEKALGTATGTISAPGLTAEILHQ